MERKSRFLHIVGTRPNFIKAWPVIQELDKAGYENRVLHTGQHYDTNMVDDILNDIGMPRPNYNIHSGTITQMIEGIETFVPAYDAVFIYGDVNSSLAGAIAAHSAKIDVIHVESGLRSGDLKMAEEVNRRVIDLLAKWKFTTEIDGLQNLQNEGLLGGSKLVGNTAIDTLRKIPKAHAITDDVKDQYALLTLHRPFNVDSCPNLTEILLAVDNLGMKFVFPVHPRTEQNILGHYNNIKFIQPLGYKDFMYLLTDSQFIISDSGGVQCEAAALNKPLFILRPSTEHKSVILHNKAKLIEPGGINESMYKWIQIEYNHEPVTSLWDGKASVRLVDEIKRTYE